MIQNTTDYTHKIKKRPYRIYYTKTSKKTIKITKIRPTKYVPEDQIKENTDITQPGLQELLTLCLQPDKPKINVTYSSPSHKCIILTPELKAIYPENKPYAVILYKNNVQTKINDVIAYLFKELIDKYDTYTEKP